MPKITEQQLCHYEGKRIVIFRLTNSFGNYAEVCNYGASIISIVVPDKQGECENVVLRYPNIQDYFSDPFYLGATIGRVANRISGAKFQLGDKMYYLDKNDGRNTNHSGNKGFHKKTFDCQVNDEEVTFSVFSPDGEGGFPGNLKLSVSYSFSENNELEIKYEASSDKVTPINFTNHAYFNLNQNKSNILGTHLLVNALHYLESDQEFLPTGKILPIDGTAFDFSTCRMISQMMQLKHDNLKGYNTYFVKEENRNLIKPIAILKDTISGRQVDLYTSMPGVLVYTGEFLSGIFKPFDGICLEAQYPPDFVNNPHLKSNILYPNKIKTDTIKYHFHCS